MPMWWGMSVMMVFIAIFWGLFSLLLVLGAMWLWRQLRDKPRRAGDSAFGLVRERYAKGEITREQFEQIASDLKRHAE